MCDVETSLMRRPWPTGGCRAKNKQTQTSHFSNNRFLILNKSVLFQVESRFHTQCSFNIPICFKSGNYHYDMKYSNYKKWLQEKLIPNLEAKSVIVVDNASYHNVQINRHPTSNARKGEMLFWLDKHGIRYSSDMTNAEIYNLTNCVNRNMRLLKEIVCSPTVDTQGSDCLFTILI
jgi:hypothetical protein